VADPDGCVDLVQKAGRRGWTGFHSHSWHDPA
jgi:hypothetical protein